MLDSCGKSQEILLGKNTTYRFVIVVDGEAIEKINWKIFTGIEGLELGIFGILVLQIDS